MTCLLILAWVQLLIFFLFWYFLFLSCFPVFVLLLSFPCFLFFHFLFHFHVYLFWYFRLPLWYFLFFFLILLFWNFLFLFIVFIFYLLLLFHVLLFWYFLFLFFFLFHVFKSVFPVIFLCQYCLNNSILFSFVVLNFKQNFLAFFSNSGKFPLMPYTNHPLLTATTCISLPHLSFLLSLNLVHLYVPWTGFNFCSNKQKI